MTMTISPTMIMAIMTQSFIEHAIVGSTLKVPIHSRISKDYLYNTFGAKAKLSTTKTGGDNLVISLHYLPCHFPLMMKCVII